MSVVRDCSQCGQSLPAAKYVIWQLVTQHTVGCSIAFLVQTTGYPKFVVQQWLNELYVEDKVYKERGKWYPEMAVSMGHHFH